MISRVCYRLLALGIPAIVLFGLVWASAATTSVAHSNLGIKQLSVSLNDLKPAACSAQNIHNLITGSGVINGTSDNDLILGGAGVDVISGGGGDDCIVGGGSADTLIGGLGNDTCIGGPGIDVIDITCERQEP